MDFLQPFSTAGLIILGLMIALWIVSLILKNSSIVDIFWGTGFVIVGWVYFALTPDGFDTRKWLIAVLTTIWGLRLSLYILWRNWGKEEDFRYKKWREEAPGIWWWKSFLQVFLLQGVLLWIISAPLLGAQIGTTSRQLTIVDFLAVLAWAIGFFFEAVGDWQLARFKADLANKGLVMNRGVWRYTRHPNYFGDAAQWWGYYLLAVSAGAWWTIFSPLMMTALLVRVSGVTLLETTMQARPGYREYIESTSAFIPWFPKKRG
jgi:steroid 5-alpha reductase family enzyme